uniref:Cystatin n=1 Tax=Rhipicephalus zambeziensis TaxID=60191 RepID=A0A224Y308_9ACAR
MLPGDMAEIKTTCVLLLLGVWAGVMLDSGDGIEVKNLDPKGNPLYLKLAHFAVSSKIAGLTVYNTVVNLTTVKTVVFKTGVASYSLDFTTAPSNCTIGKVAYSAEECLPAGPANETCWAAVEVVPPANTTILSDYACKDKKA